MSHFQGPIGRLRLCSGQQARGHEILKFLGRRQVSGARLIQQGLSPGKIPCVDRRFGGVAELGALRIVGTERADTDKQRLVVRRNLTQLRIEVFRGNVLLFKDFEEARKGSLSNAEFRSQTLKLLGGDALGNGKMNVASCLEAVGV